MLTPQYATIKMSFQNVPVELNITNPDGLTPDDVINAINVYLAAGFIAPVSWNKAKAESKIGQKAIYSGQPSFDAERKMWKYTIKLADGSDFTWNEFSRTVVRSGDTVEVVKNERGFLIGQVVDPNQKLPGMDEDDDPDAIPF